MILYFFRGYCMTTKEIVMDIKPPKTEKKKTLRNKKKLKSDLLKSLDSTSDVLSDLEVLTDKMPESKPEIKQDVTYGCLKNGSKPTMRSSKTRTVKQFTSFGKSHDVVRVLINDKDAYTKIDKDKKKLEHANMTTIRNFLRTRKLYKSGSTAPDEVLREIFINAQLSGHVENKNPDPLVHNYMAKE